MFASSEKLGYDPTIRPASDPTSRIHNQYDIDVRHEDPDHKGQFTTSTYRTRRLLSNIGAQAIRGRGTRVWEVAKMVEVVNADGTPAGRVPEDETAVLKDSWIDDSREREAVIMKNLIDSAPAKQREILIRHLLTVVCYGDVLIDNEKDRKPAVGITP